MRALILHLPEAVASLILLAGMAFAGACEPVNADVWRRQGEKDPYSLRAPKHGPTTEYEHM
jgi:hypothetical protein